VDGIAAIIRNETYFVIDDSAFQADSGYHGYRTA
jgi:hypothetical protein